MCTCINIEVGSHANSVAIPIPLHMESYRQARLKEGLSDTVGIDCCIVDEIKYLWSLGIVTYGCCCGHNKNESFVNVSEKDIQMMICLGYEMNHDNKTRRDTFKMKSA